MKTILFYITFLLIFGSSTYAQDTLPFSGKTYYNWYFGSNAGVTFNTPDKEPKFLPNNILSGNNHQNASTISDRNGNFLFHTEGELLVNNKYKIIYRDMGGNVSQSEGSVLAPLNNNRFIFFSTLYANNIIKADQFDPPRNLNDTTGLVYSIFSYDNVADTIIFEVYKKQLNESYKSEAIQLSYSAITGNYILIGYEGKGEINAFEFDLEGNYLRQNNQSYFKSVSKTHLLEIRINPACDKIAINSNKEYRSSPEENDSLEHSYIFLTSFDAVGLRFYNPKKIDLGKLYMRAIEFSSNSNYIYTLLDNTFIAVPYREFLVRYNIRKNIIEKVSEKSMVDAAFKKGLELRLAPNNKIYIFRGTANYLSSIEYPNDELYPEYKDKSIRFKMFDNISPYCVTDSPQAMSASFANIFVKSDIVLCEGERLELFAKTQLHDKSTKYSWEGPYGYKSGEQYPFIENIQLDQAGIYKVTVQNGQQIDTAETFVIVKPFPELRLRVYPNAFICDGFITLATFADYGKYLWTTGDSTRAISVKKSGTYGVTVTNEFGCESYIETDVRIGNDIKLAIEGDTIKCTGESVTLTSTDEYPEYRWSNGENTRSITVITPAKYTLTVKTEEGCTVSRTIEVKDHPKVNVELDPTPTTICSGDSTLLQSRYDLPYYSYEWNTGAKTRGIYVSNSGVYKLIIIDTRTGCYDSTEIAINVNENLQPTITGKNICSGQSATLTALPNDPSYTYEWSNGEETPVIEVTQSGTYTVTVSKAGCTGTAEYTVNESPTPDFEILGENIICNNETATLSSNQDFSKYLWSTNEVTKEIEVTQAGTYTLTVTDANGCSATQSVTVEKYELTFDISKGSIDFKKVYITETKSDNTIITNNSGFEITLANGQIIANGDSYPFNYDFVPTQLGAFNSSIEISIIEPCDTIITIPITARVYARTTISTEDIYTQIGKTETIPVYLECEADLPVQEYSITTDINRSAFFTNDNYVLNQNQIINKTKTKIHELNGTILLSESLEYDITFPNYNFTNPYIEVIQIPGKIFIDSICIFPLRNIIAFEETTLSINPNPPIDGLNVTITTGIQGTMNLELVSTDGRVIYTENWQQSTRTKQMRINIIGIPSGLYQVRLITPFDAITKSVMVVE